MKYIIDVEKIEGTNLWKAKEFNTLVFDKNGLMKMMTLEDELGYYYVELRNEVEKLQKKCKSYLKTLTELREEKKCVWNKLYKEKNEKEWWKHLYDEQEREFNILKKENKELKKYNNHLEKEWKDFDNICSRLKKENEKLKEEKKALEDKLEELETKLPCEKSVPVEEVVCSDLKGINVVDEERVVRLMTNQLEHSEREYGRLLHKIKSQKGMLKKQGKDISRLQKENKKLKFQLKKRYEEYKQIVWSNDIYKRNNKNLSIENEKLKTIICFGK